MEQLARRALQGEVAMVAGRLNAAVRPHPGRVEPGQVELHPVGPVAAVAPRDKVRALQQQRGPRNYRRLLHRTDRGSMRGEAFQHFVPPNKFLLPLSQGWGGARVSR